MALGGGPGEKREQWTRTDFASWDSGSETCSTSYTRPETAEGIFDQIIADMQLEWQEAMIHDQKWLANWIQVRGVLTVLLTVLVHAVAALGSIFKLVK